jgi:anti-sigma B factor antagonist
MTLTVSSHELADVVQMPEKLTVQNASSIAKSLTDLVDSGKSRLVLDLSALGFADSSGLAVLVTVYKSAKKNGGRVVLLSPQPNIRSLLELTRLQNVLEIFQDADAAIQRVDEDG